MSAFRRSLVRRAPHRLVLPALLLSVALPVALPAHAADWVSYRDTYRAMVVFEKYGGPKSLLQSELEVRPAERSAGLDGAQLVVSGKATQVNLPLDALGRTVFPLQKAAYDDNATLQMNRKGLSFSLRPQVTIVPRADGVYDMAELRDACAQALGFARYVDASRRTRQCAGVRFVFPKKAEAGAHLRHADGSEQVLATVAGAAFDGDADEGFALVNLRFDATPGRVQVTTHQAPLAIVPVFD